MDKRRIQRVTAATVAASLLALGGFTAGYARVQTSAPTSIPDTPTFVGLLSTYNHLRVVREESQALGIKPGELTKIEAATASYEKNLYAEQKASWIKDWEWAELAEEGKVMNASADPDRGIGADLRRWEARTRKIEIHEAEIAGKIFEVVGKARNDKVMALSAARRKEAWGVGYDILFNPEKAETIGLTQAQQNQMLLVQEFWTFLRKNPGRIPDRALRLEDVSPRAEANRAFLAKQQPAVREDYYQQMLRRLSPLQRIRTQTLVNDELYGRS